MTKKKNNNDYTSDNTKVFGLPLQFVFTILTVAVLALGSFITLRLAPLYQDIAIIRTEAYAREKKIDIGFEHVSRELEEQNNKLDKLVDFHTK